MVVWDYGHSNQAELNPRRTRTITTYRIPRLLLITSPAQEPGLNGRDGR